MADGAITEEPKLGLRFRGLLISAALIIKTESSIPEDDVVDFIFRGSPVRDPPVRDYTYFVSRNGGNLSFKGDVLLHVGPYKLASGSEIFLIAVARRVNQKKADQILVLKRLEDEKDYGNWAGSAAFRRSLLCTNRHNYRARGGDSKTGSTMQR